jgi:DNA-directed RNA polymerase specialized sigma24 family protein
LRNVWINLWRRTSLELPVPDQEEKAIEPYYDWEGDLLANQLSAGMEQALGQLPKEYLWTLLLADVEEFSYSEIAQLMECPIGTIMSRLNRARRMLARILRNDDANVTTGRAFRKAGEDQ